MTDSNRKIVALFGEVLVDAFPNKKVLGGAPFNVARHLQAFGLHPILITRTGNDATREQLLSAMDRFGMDSRGVQNDMNFPSGSVTVHTSGSSHRFEILPEQAYDHIHAGLAHMIALAVRPQMIYFGTLAQRSAASRRALTALLSSSNAPRLLDLNLRKPWYDPQTVKRSLKRADIVKLNEEELASVASMLHFPGKNQQEHAASLLRHFDLKGVWVTCGENGAWQLTKEGKTIHAQVRTRDSFVDSVGAGDGFCAVVLFGAMCGWPERLTLDRANDFASAVCSIRGAIPESQDFYRPFREKWKEEALCIS